jgi:hypothetical protein
MLRLRLSADFGSNASKKLQSLNFSGVCPKKTTSRAVYKAIISYLMPTSNIFQ